MKCKLLTALAVAALVSAALSPARAAPKPPFPLPGFVLPAPPDVKHLAPIPKTELYFVPDVDVDIVFYDGYWWTPREGRWYRSRDQRREFRPVPPAYVPAPLSKLRPDFRRHYRHERRVPYGEWKKRHWRRDWDRDRGNEWERRGNDRRDNRHDNRRDRDRGDRGRPGGRDRDRGDDGDRDRGGRGRD